MPVPTTVTVSPSSAALTSVGQTVQLTAEVKDQNGVFVTSDQPRAFFEPKVTATFLAGGREVHRVIIECHGDEMATVADEGELGLSYNAVVPAHIVVPGVELVVEVDPEGTVPRGLGGGVGVAAGGSGRRAGGVGPPPHGRHRRAGPRGGKPRLFHLRMDARH